MAVEKREFKVRSMLLAPTYGYGVSASVAVAILIIAAAINFWGAAETRNNAADILFLTFTGCLCLLASTALFSWFGVSVRDDVLDRRNPAALAAVCGAIIAVAFTYAGGNIGEGPSYWNNVFSAGLGTLGLFVLWLVLEMGTRVSSSITEERDFASGLRFCGWIVALGLICGRAVAGNWHSEADTVHDFMHDAWPAAALCLLAILIERALRPRKSRPFPAWRVYGLLPGVGYLAVAGLWLHHLGPWEGFPK